MEHQKIGTVLEYFPEIHTAEVQFDHPVKLGELLIVGKGDDQFEQPVESLMIGDEQVEIAESGSVAALHLHTEVAPGTIIYRAN